MAKNYTEHQNSLTHTVSLVLMLAFSVSCFAQVRVPFTQRTSQYTPTQQVYHVRGDFTIIGNTNLTLQNYGDLTQNGSNSMVYVDVDTPGLTGLGGTPTFNSSAATLNLSTENGAEPSCSNIVFAGLYWTGRAHNTSPSNIAFDVTKNGATKNFDKRKIQFKGPNASNYTEFTAATNNIYYPTNMDEYMYSAYAEVTDYVKLHGIGEYIAADIALNEGNGGGTGYYGGWGLIVVYENSMMNYRDVTIFDGHAFVVAGFASYDIPVAGFNTLQTGPVGVKLGMLAGEGDSGIAGDYFRIQKLNSNNYQNLNHSLNSTNNFFNSTIETGGNARNPNLLNNTGLDISMFEIPNPGNTVIGNNQTSTKFRYGSTGDTYIIFAVAMAVDAYVPAAEGIISALALDGSTPGPQPFSIEPGEPMEFKVEIKNRGSEAINNSRITIPIPYNATYDANSASSSVYFTPAPSPNSIAFDSSAGANGSLIWDIGTLPLPANPDTLLADMTFTLTATESCVLLNKAGCDNIISVGGNLSGTGAITNVPLNNASLIQGYASSGVCEGNVISGPLTVTIDATDFINQNCLGPEQSTDFVFCEVGATIPLTAINGAFPAGTLFYSQYPVVIGSTIQYTVSNPFTATAGTTTYFAVPPGSGGCFYPFTITVNSSTSTPIPHNAAYWVGATAVPITATATQPGNNLYYFISQTSAPQVSITPSTEVAGQTTYFVAEGPSASCIGPMMPIVVTVYQAGNMNAPSNSLLWGCGTTPITGLIFSTTPVTITLDEFYSAGGSYEGGGFPCDYTIYYVDSIAGNCPTIVTRTFTISDSCGVSLTTSQQITVGNNTPPTFAPLPQNQTVACGSPLNFATAVATDDCSGIIPATYADVVTAGDCNGNYSVTRTWTATDSCGNIASASQTIEVVDTVAPVITNAPQDLTLQCSTGSNSNLINWLASNGGAAAVDNCSGVIWTHNFADLQMDCSAPITVTFTATDGCGNATHVTATVISNDITPPTAPYVPNLTLNCASEIPTMTALTAIDNCQGAISSPGSEMIIPGVCNKSFTIHRSWTFIDACGNSAESLQIITIVGPTSMSFNESLPADMVLECGTVPPPPSLTVTSLCGENIPVVFTETTSAGTCPTLSEITRTWEAVDECGNHAKHTQIITITDLTPPQLTTPFDQTVAVVCSEIPPIPELQFADACTTLGEITFSEVIQDMTESTYQLIRTWIVPDSCNNISTFIQNITVTDIINESSTTVYAACNSDIGLTFDLFASIPADIAGSGTFTEIEDSGALNGSIFSPNGLSTGEYKVVYESVAGDCPASVEITITVDDDCSVFPACTIMVHNAISPNNDGANEIFYIENIDNIACFPTNQIEIYNRWGVLVYETTQYNNADRSFRGVSEGRATVKKSEELPTGTYFYLLQYTKADGSVTKEDGYLYLSR